MSINIDQYDHTCLFSGAEGRVRKVVFKTIMFLLLVAFIAPFASILGVKGARSNVFFRKVDKFL